MGRARWGFGLGDSHFRAREFLSAPTGLAKDSRNPEGP